MKNYLLISGILSLLVVWMIISQAWAGATDPRDDNVLYKKRRKKDFIKKSEDDHVVRKNFKFIQIHKKLQWSQNQTKWYKIIKY